MHDPVPVLAPTNLVCRSPPCGATGRLDPSTRRRRTGASPRSNRRIPPQASARRLRAAASFCIGPWQPVGRGHPSADKVLVDSDVACSVTDGEAGRMTAAEPGRGIDPPKRPLTAPASRAAARDREALGARREPSARRGDRRTAGSAPHITDYKRVRRPARSADAGPPTPAQPGSTRRQFACSSKVFLIYVLQCARRRRNPGDRPDCHACTAGAGPHRFVARPCQPDPGLLAVLHDDRREATVRGGRSLRPGRGRRDARPPAATGRDRATGSGATGS